MTTRILRGSSEVTELVRTLDRCPQIARYDEEGKTAAASLAYCFDSLEAHFREFLEDQLPRAGGGQDE